MYYTSHTSVVFSLVLTMQYLSVYVQIYRGHWYCQNMKDASGS